ncbi:MAG: hypothetical protein KAH07_00835 [Flavobacteriaceae bacterium]|nr:hypothetical protein [Flavobacteriaceae bacterium]
MSLKLLDGLFHHHDHFHNTENNENHFDEQHEKCPILNFELSFFSAKKHFQTAQKRLYSGEQKDNYNFVYYYTNSKYSFSLRAPPSNTNKTMTS